MNRIATLLNRTIRLVSSVALEANLLALAAAAMLAIKVLVLNQLKSLFIGAYELGLIVEAVLVSVIASYVFYLFVVHLAEYKTRQRIEPFVRKHLQQIVGNSMALLAEISQASGTELDISSCTREELQESLKKIPNDSESPLVIGLDYRPGTWLEFFRYRADRTRNSALKLTQRITLLSRDRIRLVTEIDDCAYFSMLDNYAGRKRHTGTLEFLSDAQHAYFRLCRELKILERVE